MADPYLWGQLPALRTDGKIAPGSPAGKIGPPSPPQVWSPNWWIDSAMSFTPIGAGQGIADAVEAFRGLPDNPTFGQMLPAIGTSMLAALGAVPVVGSEARAARATAKALPPVTTPTDMMRLSLLSTIVPPARQAGKVATTATASVRNASKNVSIFDPPAMPPRPFEADYPKGARADAARRLTHDIEGRPLTAQHVVGRRVVGGPEEAIPQTEEAVNAIAKAITGARPAIVAPREIGGDAGRYHEKWDRVTGDRIRQIFLNNKLAPQQALRTLGHETGHAIDYRIAGHIPTDGIKLELGRIYNDLNGERWRGARSVKTGEPVPRRYWTTPESRGYPAREVDRELMAEAVRAYMADPNYLKTVAPKTAARIRDYVNPHPVLSRFIQFNSLAAPAVPFGMLMPSILDEERLP